MTAEQDHRELVDLSGLNEGDCLEQLIERSKSAGKDDEGHEYLMNMVFRTKK